MDIRDKNSYFDNQTSQHYFSEYVEKISALKDKVDTSNLDNIVELFKQLIRNKKTLYVVGNGGSESIAQHTVTDYTKGTFIHNALRTISLGSNSSIITALGNDHSFDEIFSKQIEFYCDQDDVLFCVSSSGNSQNIINAIKKAKSIGMKTVSFTGFDGGRAKLDSDYNIHVPFNNYGIVEDIHQSLMHVIAQVIYLDINEKK